MGWMDGKHLQSSLAAETQRDETSVKGHMPELGIQSHPWGHTADIPAHAQAARLMAQSCCFWGACGFFRSASLTACGTAPRHTTWHPSGPRCIADRPSRWLSHRAGGERGDLDFLCQKTCRGKEGETGQFVVPRVFLFSPLFKNGS